MCNFINRATEYTLGTYRIDRSYFYKTKKLIMYIGTHRNCCSELLLLLLLAVLFRHLVKSGHVTEPIRPSFHSVRFFSTYNTEWVYIIINIIINHNWINTVHTSYIQVFSKFNSFYEIRYVVAIFSYESRNIRRRRQIQLLVQKVNFREFLFIVKCDVLHRERLSDRKNIKNFSSWFIVFFFFFFVS